MEDRELQEEYRKRTDRRVRQFAEEIPFEELFAEVRKVTGLNDLKFSLEIRESNRGGYPRPVFESNDILDKAAPFLNLVFSELNISSFNSEIFVDTPKDWHDMDYSKDYPIGYWCTVHLDWRSQGGGTNGSGLMRAWYENNEWKYKLEKD